MDKLQLSSDVAKEFLTILAYCDNSFLEKIPNQIVKKMNDLAADSLKDFYIDVNKPLTEQKISEECKDLLSLFYYMYMTEPSAQKNIFASWTKNDLHIK